MLFNTHQYNTKHSQEKITSIVFFFCIPNNFNKTSLRRYHTCVHTSISQLVGQFLVPMSYLGHTDVYQLVGYFFVNCKGKDSTQTFFLNHRMSLKHQFLSSIIIIYASWWIVKILLTSHWWSLNEVIQK